MRRILKVRYWVARSITMAWYNIIVPECRIMDTALVRKHMRLVLTDVRMRGRMAM